MQSCLRQFPGAFQSTPSSRKATHHNTFFHNNFIFQSTPSSRKATIDGSLHTGGIAFQSTPSSRKATIMLIISSRSSHISIHTFLAEGDLLAESVPCLCHISIHTFLAEGDQKQLHPDHDNCHFNPHLPRGRRLKLVPLYHSETIFQSTPSSRKATIFHPIDGSIMSISIHTFLAEGDLNPDIYNPNLYISIHTFLAEGDTI